MRPLNDDEQMLITSNVRLVYHVVYKMYRAGWLSPSMMEDAIGEGMFALTKAAILFDPSRGYKFSTIAIVIIRSQIRDWLKKEYKQSRMGGIRLDEAVSDRSDMSWADILPAQDDTESEAVDWLSETVITLASRYGKSKEAEMLMENVNGRTLDDMARERGVTKQRVYKQISDTKKLLRNHMSRNDWNN